MERIKLLVTKFTGKEVKKMKRLLALLTAVTLVFSTSGLSFAAFTSDGTVVKTATVSVTGTPNVAIPLSVSVKNVGTNDAAANVTWAYSGTADWISANQYLEVGGFATYAQWGIQVYTDNTNATAIPKYTGTGNPAGLVNATSTTSTLPMCHRIAIYSGIRDARFPAIGPANDDLKIQEKYIASTGDTVLLRVPGDYTADDDFFAPWFWTQDKKDLDLTAPGNQTQYTDYTTFVGSSGWKMAPGAGDVYSIPEKSAKYCVYFGAKFTGAAAGVTYTTSKLTVEMYHL